jgi:hypothetical protein
MKNIARSSEQVAGSFNYFHVTNKKKATRKAMKILQANLRKNIESFRENFCHNFITFVIFLGIYECTEDLRTLCSEIFISKNTIKRTY